ncbi:MAG: ACT domain-containing protein [Brachymonas sp.]|nr:ACT domain-containing protein [Brachymonas sp.]
MNAAAHLATLRQRYQRDRQMLLARSAQPGVAPPVQQLARLTERLLRQLWQAQQLHHQPLALVAVGGLGRGELYPHSDIDVLVLLPDAAVDMTADATANTSTAAHSDTATHPDTTLAERAAAFVRACWDAGLEVGSSVRTVAQCQQAAASDITVQTALLERRLLTGNAALYQALGAACQATLHPYAFYRAKLQEMRQRHACFKHSPYALEPDCKDGPGGLRDLQTVAWMARAAGYGPSCREWQQQGLITPHEWRQLRQHHALLRRIRWQLHRLAQRREDRLLFDLQTTLAEQPGLRPRPTCTTHAALVQPTSAPPHAAPAATRAPMRPSEKLMRRYYTAAKGVSQLVQIVLLNVAERLRDSGHSLRHDPAPPPAAAAEATASNPVANNASARTDYLAALRPRRLRPINQRFADHNGLLEVACDDLYARQPQAILETFALYQQTGLHGLSARTLRALYHARPLMNRAFRANPANRRQFMQILQAPDGITHTLRLMNQTSVLGGYLQAFRRIEGQMQHDLFHAYTVDQHTLMVVRNIRRFFNAEHAHEYPLCSQLAARWPDPWVLVVAALFHDIAKGRGGDHSLLGEQEVRRFARQHGLSHDDTELIAFLVREHLSLSQCAQKEDLSDPAVIARFARLVGKERRLTGLYLLTVADIRGTGPRVWSSWKAHLLEELYRATLHALGGHLPSEEELVQARSSGALIELARTAALPRTAQRQAHLQLWQTLDAGYFLRHDASTIAWHTQHLAPYLAQRAAAQSTAQSATQAATPTEGDAATQSADDSAREAKDEPRAQTATRRPTTGTPAVPGRASASPIAPAKAESSLEASTAEAAAANRAPCIVKARPAPQGGGLQLLVYTPDRAALFAHICGYLAQAGYSILDARIHTTRDSYALDTFQITSPRLAGQSSDAATLAHLEQHMQAAMQRALQNDAPLPEVQPGRLSRRARSFPMEPLIRLDAEEKNARWRLAIHASDRPGLLYHIARALAQHGISVQLAKISTMGERVEDSFLIEGEALQSPQGRERLEQELFAAIAAE